MEGLKTKEGRGRKPLLSQEKDREAVRKAIEQNRQSLTAAKAAFEAQGGKGVSQDTLRRFLKALAADTNASEKGQAAHPIKTYTTIK